MVQPKPRGLLELVGEAARVDHELLGHAAPDHAGSADAVLLRHHDPRPVAGRDPRRAHAARTASDDEEIDLVRTHPSSSREPISAAFNHTTEAPMAAAHQPCHAPWPIIPTLKMAATRAKPKARAARG